MKIEEKKEFDMIKREFSKLRKLSKLSLSHEEMLLSDVTKLNGFLIGKFDKDIARLTKEMIDFAYKKGWNMYGHLSEYENIMKNNK